MLHRARWSMMMINIIIIIFNIIIILGIFVHWCTWTRDRPCAPRHGGAWWSTTEHHGARHRANVLHHASSCSTVLNHAPSCFIIIVVIVIVITVMLKYIGYEIIQKYNLINKFRVSSSRFYPPTSIIPLLALFDRGPSEKYMLIASTHSNKPTFSSTCRLTWLSSPGNRWHGQKWRTSSA